MLMGFDAAFFWVRESRILTNTSSAGGSYLAKTDLTRKEECAPEFMNWALPLGRRFRALRVYIVLEYFGARGIRDFVSQGIAQADVLRKALRADEDKKLFQWPTADSMGLVVFRVTGFNHDDYDELEQALRAEGYFINNSALDGEPIVRIACGGATSDVETASNLAQSIITFVRRRTALAESSAAA